MGALNLFNVFLSSDCYCKIAGMSHLCPSDYGLGDKKLFPLIWHESPVKLIKMEADPQFDNIWGIGLTLLELINRSPCFRA
ncbi:unnamed protein product [Moneuplotes crassus]|uniref:Protein kinase domain-containing protein n=1 Tax=Euplotes crassus TaxID=5936 RepID=A0AAD1U5R9_EUPCR|nr:unnamed protein product [Moneuplotes crassus]